MSQNLSVETYLKIKILETGVYTVNFSELPLSCGDEVGMIFVELGEKLISSFILFTLENLFISSQNSYKKNVPNIFFEWGGNKFLKREGEIIIF